jgi:hypothetical protein
METEAMPKSKRDPLRQKSNLPPVPEVRRLPRPTDFNFASDNVVGPLVEGGWNIERTLAESRAEISAVSLFATPLAFNDPRQKLDRDIKAIVANYVADVARHRGRPVVRPPKLRARVSKFRNDIAKLLTNFPDPNASANDAAAASALAVDSALIDAVNIKLETQDCTNALDLEQIRDSLRALLEAVDRARADEGIGGPHRAAHVLLKNLAKVYVERTGVKASVAPDDHFGRFVEAINRQIPENYQVIGPTNLIAGAVTAANRQQISPGSPARCPVVPSESGLPDNQTGSKLRCDECGVLLPIGIHILVR